MLNHENSIFGLTDTSDQAAVGVGSWGGALGVANSLITLRA
jgi:hypothetical protein